MSDNPRWLPSLNALRAFEVVARHGSFQKAADELHVSSPAVQQLVRGLEETLGQTLVARSGRSIGVTEAGLLGVESLHAGFREITKAVAFIRAYSATRQLRVSVEPSFAAGWLIRRLSSFHAQHPSINVLIDTSERVVDLAAGEADVALRYGATTVDCLVRHELFKDETIAVCSPRVPNPPRTISDLRSHALIHFERSETLQPGWDAWLKASGSRPIRAERNLRFTDYNMMIQAAIAGHGVALASRPIAQETIEAGMLIQVFDEGVELGMSYMVLATPPVAARPDAAAFIEWIICEAGD